MSRWLIGILVFACGHVGPVSAAYEINVDELVVGCPRMTHGHGPFDYRTTNDADKRLVEGAHFTPQVENLIKGNRSWLGGDIEYTLKAFPNSPRALMSMMKLFERNKMQIPQGASAPLRCYFEHAIQFRADDPMPRMLYGIHLLKIGSTDKAIAYLESAGELDDSNPNVSYNLGLAYVQLKRYDLALDYAHKAYGGGFPLPGLRNALTRAGKWRDPVPAAPVAASAPAEAPQAEVSAPAPR
ncbi:tetratricopeptide repeat protein [Uliginosibacterium sp. H1]|uniref:tetratricopeptide repeat protein n=1 Tax=Uliginosibacterium sp. H1 TaxID=3114757 RepID=UPI002E19FFD3|nr:hypothetical protein [Uliginosibacterium sp. H1]